MHIAILGLAGLAVDAVCFTVRVPFLVFLAYRRNGPAGYFSMDTPENIASPAHHTSATSQNAFRFLRKTPRAWQHHLPKLVSGRIFRHLGPYFHMISAVAPMERAGTAIKSGSKSGAAGSAPRRRAGCANPFQRESTPAGASTPTDLQAASANTFTKSAGLVLTLPDSQARQ